MALRNRLISWLKQEQASLRQQIQMLESGKLQTGEKRAGTGWIDTTKAGLESAKRRLVKLEEILARQTDRVE